MFSLTVHVKVLHYLWQRTPPVVATVSFFFFARIKFLSQKGFPLKKEEVL